MSTEQIAKPDEGPEASPDFVMIGNLETPAEEISTVRDCVVIARDNAPPVFEVTNGTLIVRLDRYILFPIEIDPREAANMIFQTQVTAGLRVIDKGGASVH